MDLEKLVAEFRAAVRRAGPRGCCFPRSFTARPSRYSTGFDVSASRIVPPVADPEEVAEMERPRDARAAGASVLQERELPWIVDGFEAAQVIA